jgi:hypothetical protein
MSMANCRQQSAVRSISGDNLRIYSGKESTKWMIDNSVSAAPLHTGEFLRGDACRLTRFPLDKFGGYPKETPHGVLSQRYFKLQPQ